MAKRISEPLRNLDDSLRVFHVLTFRSCGIVLAFFGVCHALEWQFKAWTQLLGPMGFAFEVGLCGALALGLAWVERRDDEFLVPSALRFYAQRLFERVPLSSLATRAAGALALLATTDILLSRFITAAHLSPLPGPISLWVVAGWCATRPWPSRGIVLYCAAATARDADRGLR